VVVELRRGGREQEGSGGGWGKVTAPAAGRAKAGKKKGKRACHCSTPPARFGEDPVLLAAANVFFLTPL